MLLRIFVQPKSVTSVVTEMPLNNPLAWVRTMFALRRVSFDLRQTNEVCQNAQQNVFSIFIYFYSSLSFYSQTRNDQNVVKLLNGKTDHLLFHQKCYDYYTHPKSLKKFIDDVTVTQVDNDVGEESSEILPRPSGRKRDSHGKSKEVYLIETARRCTQLPKVSTCKPR